MHNKVTFRIERLEDRAKREPDKELAQAMVDRCNKARVLVDSVALDGSWGVHNLKYTEMILLKAKDVLNETE